MNLISSNAIISDPHIFVPDHYWCPLLGESLREAGLISQAQLNTALRDKMEYRVQRIGEILALRGWLKQERFWMDVHFGQMPGGIDTRWQRCRLLSSARSGSSVTPSSSRALHVR